MHPVLAAALDEARSLVDSRGWRLPDARTLHEVERLLQLTRQRWPAPALHVESDGAVTVAWEVAERGWVELRLDGSGQLTHSAVIDGDDYGQTEAFDVPTGADRASMGIDPEPTGADQLPGWAAEVLHRLFLPLQ